MTESYLNRPAFSSLLLTISNNAIVWIVPTLHLNSHSAILVPQFFMTVPSMPLMTDTIGGDSYLSLNFLPDLLYYLPELRNTLNRMFSSC